jgi:Group XII secretory phospholipase A2 precursor (PLA2G12)
MKRISPLFSAFSFISAAFASGLSFDNLPAIAQTAGCGSGSTVYLLKIISPVGSNQFRAACNEHDTCYDTAGESKQKCDNAFHNRMLGICARKHNTILGKPFRIACNGRADAYFAAVSEHGGAAYRKAQKNANSNGFRVRNRWNPYCLASIGDSKSIDNRVGVGTCDSSNSIWRWDGQQIRNGWNPNCLGSIGNSKAVDNSVVMGACGQSNAIWRWDGQQIRNGWNPNCLGSIGNSKAVDNPVVMGACSQSNAEWYLEKIQ